MLVHRVDVRIALEYMELANRALTIRFSHPTRWQICSGSGHVGGRLCSGCSHLRDDVERVLSVRRGPSEIPLRENATHENLSRVMPLRRVSL